MELHTAEEMDDKAYYHVSFFNEFTKNLDILWYTQILTNSNTVGGMSDKESFFRETVSKLLNHRMYLTFKNSHNKG